MQKILTHTSFVLSTLVVFAIFITSRTYLQLGIAVALYPILGYFAYLLFIKKHDSEVQKQVITQKELEVNSKSIAKEKVASENIHTNGESGSVIDNNKRDFLRMVGAAGLSFLIYSIFDRWSRNNYMEKIINIQKTSQASDAVSKDEPETEKDELDDYQITEIDDGEISFYGFTKEDGAWFILREDTEKGSYRYVKGESNFNDNWSTRSGLNYDYYYNVFK